MEHRNRLKAPDRMEKVSDGIISQIRDLIGSGELKPGDRIGSEKELLSDLGISKASLREALRVLEVMGFIEIRKGISGGVFVAEVDMKTTFLSLMSFLRFESVSVKDITLMRYILEPVIVRIVTPLVTEKDLDDLQEMIRRESAPGRTELSIGGIGFHRYLARFTHNPILILIMDFIDNLIMDIKMKVDLGDDFYKKVKAYHHRTLSCMRKKDASGAAREMIADILFVGERMARLMNVPAFDPVSLGDAPDGFSAEADTGTPERFEEIGSNPNPALFEKMSGGAPKMLLKQVGKGRFYLFVSEEEEKELN